KNISINLIQNKVAQFYNISISEFSAKKRNKNIVLPRQIAMYISRQVTNLSLPEIGLAFGGKDHTTVLHSCKKIEINLKKDSDLRNSVEKLITSIQQ
ncbi:MAG TPA: helix-turn-helix domain-containing protein, partial [Candidatus Omnitrophota bacterium]|nr:helix-turn-helix domain-containing protein [Candidatus Omnitrophota bacterium]